MDAHDKIGGDRRRFLVGAGKFAVVTPPTIALLLAADGRHYAYAGSGPNWSGGSQGKYQGDNGDKGNNGDHYGWYKNGKAG